MITLKDISNLGREDKFKIYLHYLIVSLSLKHRAHFRDVLHDPEDYGWGPYDKKVGNLEIRYLWKNDKYYEFEEMPNEKLHDWYLKFRNEIDITWEEK